MHKSFRQESQLTHAGRMSDDCRSTRRISTGSIVAELVGGIGTRNQLITDCNIILLPKVQAED